MSFWDDITPDFSDPGTMAAFGALGNVLQAGTAPRFAPNGNGITGGGALNALAALTGAGIKGMNEGANFAQQYQAENLANQGAGITNQQNALNLNFNKQRLASFGSLSPNASGALSPTGTYGPQDYMKLAQLYNASPNAEDRKNGVEYSKIALDMMKSGVTTDPATGAVIPLQGAQQTSQANSYASELGKTQGGIYTDANGVQHPNSNIMGTPNFYGNTSPAISSAAMNDIIGSRTPALQGPGAQAAPMSVAPAPVSSVPMPPGSSQLMPSAPAIASSGAQSTINNAIAPAQGQNTPASPLPAKSPVSMVTASDGKPYVPEALALPLRPADPTGTPSYSQPSTPTTTSVNQVKEFQSKDLEDQDAMTAAVSNTNQMLARLHDISNNYNQIQSGTLISQNPELMNKLIGLGFITDKGVIKNVAGVQSVLGDQALEVLNQLKSATSTGEGGAKILNSEVKNATGKLGDPALQPQAIQDIMGVSTGMANYNKDMANGYNAIGGLGNRIAGGYTLRPIDYQSKFAATHNIDDYIAQAKQNMPPVMGAPVLPLYREGQTATNPKTGQKLTFSGGKWQ